MSLCLVCSLTATDSCFAVPTGLLGLGISAVCLLAHSLHTACVCGAGHRALRLPQGEYRSWEQARVCCRVRPGRCVWTGQKGVLQVPARKTHLCVLLPCPAWHTVQGMATAPCSLLIKAAKSCCDTQDDVTELPSQLKLTPVTFRWEQSKAFRLQQYA